MSSWGKQLRISFFAGLLLVVPLAVSVLVLQGLFEGITNRLLPRQWHDHRLVFLYRIVALVLAAGFVTAVGWVTRLVIGREILAAVERVIRRVPLLNKTYGFMKHMGHTFLSDRQSAFQRVVLVEYPRPGIYTLAFATAETGGEANARTGHELVSVFLPTPPNPTTGYLALFPRARVTAMEMSVADAMKMAFSGGAIVPSYPAATAGRMEAAP